MLQNSAKGLSKVNTYNYSIPLIKMLIVITCLLALNSLLGLFMVRNESPTDLL